MEYVSPAAGIVLSNCMVFAPYGDLKKAIQNGHLGNLNPTPWAFMMANCFGWLFYGILQANLWVFAGNVPGFIMSVWMNLAAVKLLYQEHYSTELRTFVANYLILNEQQINSPPKGSTIAAIVPSPSADRSDPIVIMTTSTGTSNPSIAEPPLPKVEKDTKPANAVSDVDFMMTKSNKEDWSTIVWDVTSQQMTPAPSRHENLILGLVFMWTIVGSVITLVKDESILSKETTQLIVGLLNNIILISFYAAPLSTIRTVLQDRNTASLHVPTMIVNTLNSTFWMVYGIAVVDYFQILPNGLGACLGAFQIVLSFIFPRGTANVVDAGNDRISSSNNNSSNGTEILFMEPPGTLEAPLTITPIGTDEGMPFFVEEKTIRTDEEAQIFHGEKP
eukprot:scaffold17595_cov113-Cylindrotheca_fusiformis.AAC.9